MVYASQPRIRSTGSKNLSNRHLRFRFRFHLRIRIRIRIRIHIRFDFYSIFQFQFTQRHGQIVEKYSQ